METNIEIEESKGKNKGFTLIELLIVIVILGILAAVTVFAVRGITDKGKTSACASDQATLATAVESYFAQFGGTAIPHTAGANATAPGVTYTVASVAIPAGAGWSAGTTVDVTLVNAGFLRSVSAKYITSEDGKTLTPTTAGGC